MLPKHTPFVLTQASSICPKCQTSCPAGQICRTRYVELHAVNPNSIFSDVQLIIQIDAHHCWKLKNKELHNDILWVTEPRCEPAMVWPAPDSCVCVRVCSCLGCAASYCRKYLYIPTFLIAIVSLHVDSFSKCIQGLARMTMMLMIW